MVERIDSITKANCPRILFDLNLTYAVVVKIVAFYQIITMEDFNSRYDDFQTWMLNFGLLDLVAQKNDRGP